MESTNGFRYAELADALEAQIRAGTFRTGEKLPSIRGLRLQTGLSISTVYQAFIELEKRGMVEARQKSGYYVKPQLHGLLPPPRKSAALLGPQKVNISDLAFALIEAMGDPGVLQLGGALIHSDLLPPKELPAIIRSAPLRQLKDGMAAYEHYLGHPELRRQIARRMAPLCGPVSPEEMVITNGCIEAVALSLKAVTGPGDTVLVESPTFPWFLQLIEDLNLRALEIPTDPSEGIDLEVLQAALENHAVRAAIFVANFHNPLGFLMPDEKKQAVVALFNARRIPIIEDDIYGELYFGASRPLPLKAFDQKGLVLYCASFSKSLAPGLRVGWVMPGQFLDRIKRYRLNQHISAPGLTQWALGRYLQTVNYDRHLRRLRTQLKNQVGNTALAIARWFPPDTKITAPRGGVVLWVQLNERVDSLELFRAALEKRIAVFPGVICANSDIYRNYIRINCGMPYTDAIDRGIQTLAGIVARMSR